MYGQMLGNGIVTMVVYRVLARAFVSVGITPTICDNLGTTGILATDDMV